jgi:hypothetical protein
MTQSHMVRDEAGNDLFHQLEKLRDTLHQLMDDLQTRDPEKMDEIARRIGTLTPNVQKELVAKITAIATKLAHLKEMFNKFCEETARQEKQRDVEREEELSKYFKAQEDRIREAIDKYKQNVIEMEKLLGIVHAELVCSIQKLDHEIKELTEVLNQLLVELDQINKEVEVCKKELVTIMYGVADDIRSGKVFSRDYDIDKEKLYEGFLILAKNFNAGHILSHQIEDNLNTIIDGAAGKHASRGDKKEIKIDIYNTGIGLGMLKISSAETKKMLKEEEIADKKHLLAGKIVMREKLQEIRENIEAGKCVKEIDLGRILDESKHFQARRLAEGRRIEQDKDMRLDPHPSSPHSRVTPLDENRARDFFNKEFKTEDIEKVIFAKVEGHREEKKIDTLEEAKHEKMAAQLGGFLEDEEENDQKKDQAPTMRPGGH